MDSTKASTMNRFYKFFMDSTQYQKNLFVDMLLIEMTKVEQIYRQKIEDVVGVLKEKIQKDQHVTRLSHNAPLFDEIVDKIVGLLDNPHLVDIINTFIYNGKV